MNPPPLWAALILPRLPIDLLTRANPAGSPLDEAPLAVVTVRKVVACNTAAAAAGVQAGMALSAALALVPALIWRERDPAAEKAALADIATWALQFTSCISLHPPAALLLEIGASLRLFKGLDALLERLAAGMGELGFGCRCGVAPTPQGALLLARSPLSVADRAVTGSPSLRERLVRLPVAVLETAQSCHTTLDGMGVTMLADLLALPRAGLNRRCGPDLLDELDRALGSTPDPRRPFVPLPRFTARLELPCPTAAHEPLLFACKRLFNQLEGFLRSRRAGVRSLDLVFHQEDPGHAQQSSPLRLTLNLLEPGDTARHFAALLHERLARTALDAPAGAVTLEAGDIAPLDERSLSLLPDDPRRNAEGLSSLLERLLARLGQGALRRLQAAPDHRPERASRLPTLRQGQPAGSGAAQLAAPRPVWILAQPQALEEADAVPQYQGPLTLLAGPERIESGWWDGAEAARDYFVAATRRDALVWIYRERKAADGGWFLHGFFA